MLNIMHSKIYQITEERIKNDNLAIFWIKEQFNINK